MEKIIAGYTRVSTEMQVERDSSLITQEEIISNFAKSKNKEFRIYKDAGISAKNRDRPQFLKMLDDIKAGMIEAVVVTKLDRITRTLKDLIFLKEFFEEYGVSFVSVTQNIDTSTPMGRFAFYLLGLVAQLEREVTAERVSGDMKQRAKRGKWNGGPIPFGYTREDGSKNLVINHVEADTVKRIYQLYLKQKSFRSVVHALNSLKITTRGGEAWAATSVRRVLTNPIYYGTLTYNKRKSEGKTSKPRPKEEHILVEGVCDPIIPKDQWEEVQEIASDQKKPSSASKGSKHLLTGLLECGHCKTKLYGYNYNGHRKDGKTYRYYRCNGHISKGSAFCPGNTVDAKWIEEIILNELRKISTNPDTLIERAKDFQTQYDREVKPLLDEQKTIQQSLAKIGKRAERLLRLYEDEVIEKGEFVKERAILDSEKKFLESELEDVAQKIFTNDLSNFDLQATLSCVHNLSEVFEELDFQERKELLRTIINKVVVGKHHLDFQFFALPKSFVNWDCTPRGSWQRPA